LASRSSKSKRSSGSAEPELPAVFVDRSLGAYDVPEGLRAVGFTVHTMADVYGEALGQKLGDVEWIPDVTEQGLVILSKDSALRHGDELEAIIESTARVFLAPDAQSTAAAQIERFTTNRFRIAMRARKPGPLVCIVRPSNLETVKLS
jgi:hypothetical protein